MRVGTNYGNERKNRCWCGSVPASFFFISVFFMSTGRGRLSRLSNFEVVFFFS